MKKLTIADYREQEVIRLARIHTGDNDIITEETLKQARRLMNSFYRLCGLCERNLYMSNDERFYTRHTAYVENSENRASKWHERLNKEFYDFAGLQLVYCGYCPSIGMVTKGYGFSEKINRYFYN